MILSLVVKEIASSSSPGKREIKMGLSRLQVFQFNPRPFMIKNIPAGVKDFYADDLAVRGIVYCDVLGNPMRSNLEPAFFKSNVCSICFGVIANLHHFLFSSCAALKHFLFSMAGEYYLAHTAYTLSYGYGIVKIEAESRRRAPHCPYCFGKDTVRCGLEGSGSPVVRKLMPSCLGIPEQVRDIFAEKTDRAVCDDLVKRYIYARRKIRNLQKAWAGFGLSSFPRKRESISKPADVVRKRA